MEFPKPGPFRVAILVSMGLLGSYTIFSIPVVCVAVIQSMRYLNTLEDLSRILACSSLRIVFFPTLRATFAVW